MMKHKWHNEICAWAKGKRIQVRIIFSAAVASQWHDVDQSSTPDFNNPELEFRIAPKMRRVTLESGEVVEWPEPMREAPEKGTKYWFPLVIGSTHFHGWCGDAVDDHNLKLGRCHATQSAAEQHAEALRKINGAVE